jgi:hypothetical protein
MSMEAIPILWLSPNDLLHCRPDLSAGIERLSEDEFSNLAKDVNDALQETYHLALELALLQVLGQQEAGESET